MRVFAESWRSSAVAVTRSRKIPRLPSLFSYWLGIPTNNHCSYPAKSPQPGKLSLLGVQTAGKAGKQIERCVIASFQIAESMSFKGEFRQWEVLLRIGD
jgi:hypothetical protein